MNLELNKIKSKRKRKWQRMSMQRWRYICCHCKLSEDFLRKYNNKFDDYCWYRIGTNQNLSKKFKKDFYKKLKRAKFIAEFDLKVDWSIIKKNSLISQ